MNFTIQITTIIVLLILNITAYIITFSSDFAIQNKDFYDIISIFNEFIFLTCLIAGFKLLKKAKFVGSIISFSIPLLYTAILYYFFR
ncbi:MAG: hypothetical protein IJY92_02780 [Alphaproteobacteria bacterium]|nr:hypothetical protein [Alphaproteobacteria bacterium]